LLGGAPHRLCGMHQQLCCLVESAACGLDWRRRDVDHRWQWEASRTAWFDEWSSIEAGRYKAYLRPKA
jgi:hypothetical protein